MTPEKWPAAPGHPGAALNSSPIKNGTDRRNSIMSFGMGRTSFDRDLSKDLKEALSVWPDDRAAAILNNVYYAMVSGLMSSRDLLAELVKIADAPFGEFVDPGYDPERPYLPKRRDVKPLAAAVPGEENIE
jgi:hypothetical protein